MIDSFRGQWYRFRYWLASRIVGMDIISEIDAAYEAGRQWGKAERDKGLPGD